MEKIIYIAGTGRSGTTIIEKCLAAAGRGLALGETELLWSRAIIAGEPCSCSRLVDQCEVWSRLLSTQQIELTSAILVENSRSKARSTLLSWIPIVGAYYDIEFVPKRISETTFGRAVHDLYKALESDDSAPFCIDSSKKPLYAALLSRIAQKPLCVVHVVRDLRGYVWSMRKKRLRGYGSNEEMKRSTLLMSVIRWFRIHARARMLRRIADTYIEVKYESFVDDPRGHSQWILTQFGLQNFADVKVETGNAAAGIFQLRVHQIAGNPNRFDDTDLFAVHADLEWRRKMPRIERLVLGLLMFVGAKRYQYPIRA